MEFMNNPIMIRGLVQATWETIWMLLISGSIALVLGLVVGVIVTVTNKDGLLENKVLYFIFDKFINFFRAVPFVILIPLMMGLSRLLVGTATGTLGMIVTLVFGIIPFFARQVQSALADVDSGLIEASISMGDSPFQIITRVYLRESIPGLIRSISMTLVSALGLTAMAGQVGGGGLGAFAIRYGYQSQEVDATWTTVVIILLIVVIIESSANYFAKKLTH
ncbi:ABC transporter permease [Erysipelotrichaceae bacterium MTC7]|nr:ABC transporter permease [Erysipelotrichaceae bacterium MTC7]